MRNFSRGFLSVDIAVSLLIMSFAFVLLFQAQSIIAKQLKSRDIQNFQETNDIILEGIKQQKCQQRTLTTKQNHTYKMCLIEGKGKNGITLHYYVPY